MTQVVETQKPTRTFWIISVVALLWNLTGVAAYLGSVTVSAEDLAALSEAEQALYNNTPTWVTSAYAIAVFVGLLGSILLLMRRALAVPAFLISLIAIAVQMGYALFVSPALEVRGATAAILPVLVILIACYLVWFSNESKKKALLR